MALASRETLAAASTPRAPGTWRRASPGCARRPASPARVVVPDHAPQAKIDGDRAARAAAIVKVPFERWWQVLVDHRVPGHRRRCSSTRSPTGRVIAGNGTIGLEILEDLPDVDAVLVSLRRRRALLRDRVGRARAAAVGEGLSPARSRRPRRSPRRCAAGRPTAIEYTRELRRRHRRARRTAGDVAARLEPARRLDRRVARRDRRRDSPAGHPRPRRGRGSRRRLCRRRRARPGRAGNGKLVCVVSGGNIDAAMLASILAGATPQDVTGSASHRERRTN